MLAGDTESKIYVIKSTGGKKQIKVGRQSGRELFLGRDSWAERLHVTIHATVLVSTIQQVFRKFVENTHYEKTMHRLPIFFA